MTETARARYKIARELGITGERRSVDMDRVVAALGGERVGKVHVRGGYFGSMQLAAEVAAIRREREKRFDEHGFYRW